MGRGGAILGTLGKIPLVVLLLGAALSCADAGSSSLFDRIQYCLGLLKSPQLTSEEIKAIRDYSGEGFRKTNQCLRDPATCTSEVLKEIDVLTEAIRKLPSYGKKTVYREIMVPLSFILERYKVGTVVREDSFLSTSASLEALALETEDLQPWKSLAPLSSNRFNENYSRSVLFEIISASGKDIREISDNFHEEEVLFSPGKLFRVEMVGENRNGIQIRLREIFSDGPSRAGEQ